MRGIPGLKPGQLIEILTGVKLWWIRLSSELFQITFQIEGANYYISQNAIGPCVFQVLRRGEEGHRVKGLIFTHVDDLMLMADPTIHNQLEEHIQNSQSMNGNATALTMWVEYHFTEEEINITQAGYVQSRPNKVKIPPHQAETDAVDAGTKEHNRSVVGSLGWRNKLGLTFSLWWPRLRRTKPLRPLWM